MREWTNDELKTLALWGLIITAAVVCYPFLRLYEVITGRPIPPRGHRGPRETGPRD